MPVPTSIEDLQAQEALNYPKGTDNVGGTIDDYFRAHASIIRRDLSTGGDVASASTLNIPLDGQHFSVTGNINISSINNSLSIGRVIYLEFKGSLTLISSSSLGLPGGLNYKVVPSDIVIFVKTAEMTWTLASASNITSLGHSLQRVLTYGPGEITSYTKTPGTRKIIVEGVGGGGSGGSSSGTNPGVVSASNGGGAGGYFKIWRDAPSGSVAVTIGVGGAHSVAGLTNGKAGNNTVFDGTTAGGGGGGGQGPGLAFADTIAIPSGIPGTLGGVIWGGYTGIRAAGGNGQPGWAVNKYQVMGGAGGDSFFGGGGLGSFGTNNGNAPSAPGGGGGGCSCLENSPGGSYGGNGAGGILIIYEYA